LGLRNPATAWTFLIVLGYGFVGPVLMAFIVTLTPIVSFLLWLQGGVKRAIARSILVLWLAFIGLSALGVYVFSLWDGLNIAPTPWMVYTLLRHLPTGSEAYHHCLLSVLSAYSLLFIALIPKVFSAKTKAEKIFGHAHLANAFEIQRAGLFSEAGIVLGKAHGKSLRLPGFEGVLVVAPTGAGKTTAIAVPNLLEWPGSGVFNDLKGELYRLSAQHRQTKLNNACFLWAPADTRKQSARYNPFFYVSHNPDLRIRDLQLIAETLIPASRLGDGFWYQSSREIFLMLSLYLFETQHMATLSEIHDLSKQNNFFVWLFGEIRQNEAIFSKHLKQNAYAILGTDEKTQKNILKDFHSRMGLFNDPLMSYATSGNDFDFRELRREKISIYVQIPDADKERLSPILTLFWAQMINTLSAHAPAADEPYGVLALMDEFGNMARINKLKDGMSFLRSYHLRPIIIVQYLGQIIATYGRNDAKGFLNSKVKIAFALNDMDDAQFFSKSLGTKTVRVSSSSVSTGHGDNLGSRSESFNFQSRALMHPDELMQLSSKKAIILIEAKNPIKAYKCYWFKEPKYQELLHESTAVDMQ
jgi:type IV secretion system protein VirD4